MVASSHKAKQYGWFALKVFILVCAFVFIYRKWASLSTDSWDIIGRAFQVKNGGITLLFIGMAAANWFFEILKWKTLVSVVQKISFWEAGKQSLAALTVSLATPNRIGEYGAKAYFFQPKHRKKILLFNAVGNLAQLFWTCVFGIWGAITVVPKWKETLTTAQFLGFMAGLVVISVMGYLFRNKEWFVKGLSIQKILGYLKKLPSVTVVKVMVFSALRYLFFSSLLYFLLYFFGAEMPYVQVLPYITALYFLASVVPVFSFFDVVIKGSIAVWLLSFLGINEAIVLAAIATAWALNFVIPALIGSVFMFKFKHP
ncbi:MAG: lysylphosphatidylglycerol synthase domain-containing protein [Flavobacteriaceae bacterium]